MAYTLSDADRKRLRKFICNGGVGLQTQQGLRLTEDGFEELAAKSDAEILALLTLWEGAKVTQLNKQLKVIQDQIDVLSVVIKPVDTPK